MTDISRDSFRETQNVLNDLRNLLPVPQSSPKHYVSVRLQQGVPLLDADWNEVEDIRRLELESVLAKVIGNGVPAADDAFRIGEAAVTESNFSISGGVILFDGWIVYNPNDIEYVDQPHQAAAGVAPELPIPLPDAPIARRELIYIDAWEQVVNSPDDESIVDPRIGIETAVRLERVWLVRAEPIADSANPNDPETIPNRQPGHRYYPIALIDRQPGNQIADTMLTDIRRTHLTLDALTHAPLFIDDVLREQRLDSERLAAAFDANLAALDDVFRETPDAFVFPSEQLATWSLMTIYQDLRAISVALREQALRDQLPAEAAMGAMTRLFEIQDRFRREIDRLILPPPDGIGAGESAENFVEAYRRHLIDEPDSLSAAVAAGDLLGAVLAQERINHEIGDRSVLDGTVGLALISITPNEPVVANVLYQLTIRLISLLISDAGEEDIRVTAAAGLGWNLSFEGSTEPDPAEIVLTVPNQTNTEIVLRINTSLGTAPTVLELRAFPERRQQRLFRHQDVPMAIGHPILVEEQIPGTLTYQGPPLAPPDNRGEVPRATMFNPGVPLPFRIDNISAEEQTFELTITPAGTPNGWDATSPSLAVAPIAAGAFRDVNVTFRTSDQLGADSPQAFTLQLTQVVDPGDDVPLPSTAFTLTLVLT